MIISCWRAPRRHTGIFASERLQFKKKLNFFTIFFTECVRASARERPVRPRVIDCRSLLRVHPHTDRCSWYPRPGVLARQPVRTVIGRRFAARRVIGRPPTAVTCSRRRLATCWSSAAAAERVRAPSETAVHTELVPATGLRRRTHFRRTSSNKFRDF